MNTRNQKVELIKIKDLVLWTENPREPIDENATDQEIVDRAFEDKRSKWTLPKLAKEMGDYYDFSEIPTVVYHNGKPVVYDGNRRMILGKIKLGLVSVPNGENIRIPDFPTEIPCNVCSQKIGLNNVWRKHGESGSWAPLERDIFLHKFMGQEKSSFLIIDEDTEIIRSNPHLNQRFVKDEIFNDGNLKKMGFEVTNGRFKSLHSNSEARQILKDISEKVERKVISTRYHRGKILEVLDPSTQQLIDYNKSHGTQSKNVKIDEEDKSKLSEQKQHTRRAPRKRKVLFGGKLFLRMSDTSDLYRDIEDLFAFYNSKKNDLSDTFTGLIRMSLRLLCETAAEEDGKTLDNYLKSHFAQAKKTLTQDVKTTLSNHNVTEGSIIQLLHTAAHNYKASQSLDQTIAMSIIIGAILSISHGK